MTKESRDLATEIVESIVGKATSYNGDFWTMQHRVWLLISGTFELLAKRDASVAKRDASIFCLTSELDEMREERDKAKAHGDEAIAKFKARAEECERLTKAAKDRNEEIDELRGQVDRLAKRLNESDRASRDWSATLARAANAEDRLSECDAQLEASRENVARMTRERDEANAYGKSECERLQRDGDAARRARDAVSAYVAWGREVEEATTEFLNMRAALRDAGIGDAKSGSYLFGVYAHVAKAIRTLASERDAALARVPFDRLTAKGQEEYEKLRDVIAANGGMPRDAVHPLADVLYSAMATIRSLATGKGALADAYRTAQDEVARGNARAAEFQRSRDEALDSERGLRAELDLADESLHSVYAFTAQHGRNPTEGVVSFLERCAVESKREDDLTLHMGRLASQSFHDFLVTLQQRVTGAESEVSRWKSAYEYVNAQFLALDKRYNEVCGYTFQHGGRPGTELLIDYVKRIYALSQGPKCPNCIEDMRAIGVATLAMGRRPGDGIVSYVLAMDRERVDAIRKVVTARTALETPRDVAGY